MAIDGTYQMTVELGGKSYTGTVQLATAGSTVDFVLKAPVIGTIKEKGTAGPGDTFSVAGKTRVLFKKITFDIKGCVEGDKLTATVSTSQGSLDVVGMRIQ